MPKAIGPTATNGDIDQLIVDVRAELDRCLVRANNINKLRIDNDKAIRNLQWALRNAQAVKLEGERMAEQQGVKKNASSTTI